MLKRVRIFSLICTMILMKWVPVSSQILIKGPYLMLKDGNGDEITIAWTTDNGDKCKLEFGTTNLFGNTRYATGTAIPTTDFRHQVILDSLSANTVYYYRVTDSWASYEGSFTTAPVSTDASTKFLVYTDPQFDGEAHDLVASNINSVYEEDPGYKTFLLCSGDISDTQEGYQSNFFEAGNNVREMLKNLFFETAKGNHDGMYNDYENSENFAGLFPYSDVPYYSFDYGPVHVAVADFNTLETSGTQYDWLIADLKSSTSKWKFIDTHMAGYCASGGYGDNQTIISIITDLSNENVRVPIVFGGHHHFYTYAAATEDNGFRTRHITNGPAGGSTTSRTGEATPYTITVINGTRTFSKVEIVSDCLAYCYTINGETGELLETIVIDRPCGVNAYSSSETSETITWSTANSSTSIVEYGETTMYTETQTGAEGIAHSVTLTGLNEGTTYHFRVISGDEVSDDYTFTAKGKMWTGEAGTDWNNTGNWFGSAVPDVTTSVVIPAVTNQPHISSNTSEAAECYNLTINSGASLTIDSGNMLTVAGDIKNNGTLTIESESLTNNGSLIVKGTSTGNATYNRVMPESLYRYISSPVSSASLPSGQTYWLWDELTGDWAETTSCVSGIGCTMLTSGNIVSFTGTVVNSTSYISTTSPYSDCSYSGGDYATRTYAAGRDATTNYGGGGFNLLGNPFTSAMNATTFISANAGNFDPNYQALYIYNGDTYTYIGSEFTGWENADGSFGYTDIQVGQGFFVLAHCNTSAFTFTPAMQTHSTAVPMTKSTKSSDRWPGLQLKAKTGNAESSTIVVYNSEMTAGLDPGFDIGQFNAGADIEIYTAMSEENGVNYARQALPKTGHDIIILPLGIDLPAGGQVTFTADTEPLEGCSYILEDRTTGTLTDLSTCSYTVTLPAKTYGTGRFYLRTKVSGTTDITPEPENPDTLNIRLWSSDNVVYVKGSVSDKAIVTVHDMHGQIVLENKLYEGTYNHFTVTNASKGIYIVRVVDGTKVITKKIMLM
jgi:hypothetical protein